MRLRLCLFLCGFLPLSMRAEDVPPRPHILWLTSEDHGPEMGCYGDPLARTPAVDRLAERGMRFDVVWSTAPVCAPARTAILTGLYPSSSGGLHMRSSVRLPPEAHGYPHYLREAGYYCTNNSKEDYNVVTPAELWHASSRTAHWRDRAEGQPFFAIFNSMRSHESQLRTRPHAAVTDPAQVRVPAYHPDTPEVRQDWAQYYDKVSEADAEAGERLRELAEAGLEDNTIVFYYGDHGSGMPRSKRWPSDSGLRVPLVVYFPPRWRHLAPSEYETGGMSERRVGFVDLAPTLLSLAGVRPPAWMQGRAFAGPYQVTGPEFVFGERGRMDERLDLVRSVTDGRFVYVRNYMPHVSQGQRVAYQFLTPTTRVWRERFDRGETTPAQSQFWRVPKEAEELYDLAEDPDEVNNLAGRPEFENVLNRLRAAQRAQVLAVRDVGFLPEDELHARAAADNPFTMARDEGRYPLARILAAAEQASQPVAGDESVLAALLADADSAVRYWAVVGFRIRGGTAVAGWEAPLRIGLGDPAPSVRVAAAEVLVRYGRQEDREAGLAVLEEMARPAERGVLVAMAALSAIEALGERAGPLRREVAGRDARGPSPHPRFDEYVGRLLLNLAEPPSAP